MIWDRPMILAIILGIFLAVVVGLQVSGIWNCC